MSEEVLPPEDEFPERINKIVDLVGNKEKLGRKAGISAVMISKYAAGFSEPSRDKLIALASAAGVRVEWLATGEGPMKCGEVRAGQVGPVLDANEFVLVPRYDVKTSCGGGVLVESEQVVDHLAFKRRWITSLGLQEGCLALISAKGDSMEPTIKDGYLLLVDLRQSEIKADAIYVLRIDHELVAKRCQKLFTGDLKIKSDNAAYDEQLVPVDQIAKLDIIGRVVWGGGKM